MSDVLQYCAMPSDVDGQIEYIRSCDRRNLDWRIDREFWASCGTAVHDVAATALRWVFLGVGMRPYTDYTPSDVAVVVQNAYFAWAANSGASMDAMTQSIEWDDDVSAMLPAQMDPYVQNSLAPLAQYIDTLIADRTPVVDVETSLVDDVKRFGGTRDHAIIREGKLWICDIKTGKPKYRDLIQMAAYATLQGRRGVEIGGAQAVHIPRTKGAKRHTAYLHSLANVRAGARIFLAGLEIYRAAESIRPVDDEPKTKGKQHAATR